MRFRNHIFLLFFLFMLTFAAVAQSPVDFPATAAGKRAALFLRMLGSTDDAGLKEFIEGSMMPNPNLTPDQRIARFRGIRQNLAGARLIKILRSSDESIQFVIENSAGEQMAIVLDTTPDAEKRVAGFGVEEYGKNSAGATEDRRVLSETELLPAVEKYLDELAKADKFSGVVLIAKNGKPLFTKAYGPADRAKNIPNKVDTKFNIGSENKIFTQLAIGMLADEGKLALSDKLGKFLPDYPNKQAAEKVTVEQLLAMRSGIGDFFGPEFQAADKSKIRKINDFLPLFAAKPLLFEPGTKNQYSNGGYIVLGAIIEKVTGKSYYDFVRERIFTPAGMSDTESYEIDASIANMAEGYSRNLTPGQLVNNRPERAARASSAGGGYSTAADMLKFANALESGKLAIPKSLAGSSDPMVAMAAGGIGIAGGMPGANAAFETRVKGAYTIVVMSNLDPPSAESVSRQIRIWLGAN
jgi:CubicO group peptidase (beta-lactamase class C family)